MTLQLNSLHPSVTFAFLVTAVPVYSQAAAPPPPTYDHIVVVVEENESLGRVMGSGNAPYIDSLAAGGVSFTNFFAITHPSQPNYLQLFSGSNQGTFDDTVPPPGAQYVAPNLAAALGSGNFAGYSEDLPALGSTAGTSGLYARKHAPWVNWQGTSTNQLPTSVNRPFYATTSGTPDPTKPFYGDLGATTDAGGLNYSQLPKVSFVVPNLVNDMHNGSYPGNIAAGDTWLQNNLSGYATWAASHNSLLIVTFDEDNSSGPNKIPTVLYGAHLNNGTTNDTTYTLHNLLRTVEDTSGAAYHSGSAANVQPISTIFAGQPTGTIQSFQQGNNSYSGAHDTMVRQVTPSQSEGSTALLVVDNDDPSSTGNDSQALVRFDDILGSAPGQVPAGATILSAKLIVTTGAASNDNSNSTVELHRMLTSWNDNSTWNTLANGVSANGSEAQAAPDFSLIGNLKGTTAIFDVTDTIQAWADGATNYGWAILPTGSDGWRFNSSEASSLTDRPRLEITYNVPEPTLGLLMLMLLPPVLLSRRQTARA